jgi:glycosyltransferase involved in cell wall biosynthesis
LKNRVKILIAISSLNLGGAEVQFIELVKGIDKSTFDVRVIVMYHGTLDPLLEAIEEIQIYRLNKKNKYDFNSYIKYIRIINEFAPSIIYSFLPDLNVISFICKGLSIKKPKLFWGIRAGTNEIKKYSRLSQLVFYLQKMFSSKISLAVFNSYQGQIDYLNAGFHFKKSIVIPNGMNSDRFKPDADKRIEFRNKYKINENDVAIGIVSRFEYIKGMDIFVSAANKLLNKYDNLFFFSIGHGDEGIIEACKETVEMFYDSRFFFLGKISTPESIICGWDIYCSTSRGEGFSNSIAEAMLCGLPVVVSNVGDSSKIVNEFGLVFSSENIEELCEKIEIFLDKRKRERIGSLARKHVTEKYSTTIMVESTQNEFINFSNK